MNRNPFDWSTINTNYLIKVNIRKDDLIISIRETN